MDVMERTALGGLTIIEDARFVAGPFCAKLLADMGAEVIKIEEPATGDEARARGPFPGDLPHPERSGLFLYLNTNKMSVTLDLRDPAGYDIFVQLLRQADILVQDRSPHEARELRTDYETLKRINPRLIVTSVTPFGQTGPYAEFKAHSLNICHAGGEGYLLPGGLGHQAFPDRPPVKLGGHTAEYDAGMAAAVGTMAAILARELWGVGQHVDISKQEAQIALNRVAFVTYLSEGKVPRRENRSYSFGGLYRARDGYVVLRPTENNHWQALVGLMGEPHLAEDPRFKDRQSRASHGAELNLIVGRWAGQRTKQEVFDACRGVGCPVAPFADAAEIASSPQLRWRGFFAEIEHPEAGRWKYPTAPYQFSQTPWSVRRPPPLLGQHNRDVFQGILGLSAPELAILRAHGSI